MPDSLLGATFQQNSFMMGSLGNLHFNFLWGVFGIFPERAILPYQQWLESVYRMFSLSLTRCVWPLVIGAWPVYASGLSILKSLCCRPFNSTTLYTIMPTLNTQLNLKTKGRSWDELPLAKLTMMVLCVSSCGLWCRRYSSGINDL